MFLDKTVWSKLMEGYELDLMQEIFYHICPTVSYATTN